MYAINNSLRGIFQYNFITFYVVFCFSGYCNATQNTHLIFITFESDTFWTLFEIDESNLISTTSCKTVRKFIINRAVNRNARLNTFQKRVKPIRNSKFRTDVHLNIHFEPNNESYRKVGASSYLQLCLQESPSDQGYFCFFFVKLN